jgi:hypothetical protein
MSMPFPATVRGRRLLPLPYHPNRSSSKRRSSRLARSQEQASRGPRPPRGRRAQREPPRRSFHGGAHRRSSPGTSPSTPPPTGTGMPPLHPRPPWSTIHGHDLYRSAPEHLLGQMRERVAEGSGIGRNVRIRLIRHGYRPIFAE